MKISVTHDRADGKKLHFGHVATVELAVQLLRSCISKRGGTGRVEIK